MRIHSTGELASMQGFQYDNMQDRCRILTYSETRDSNGVRWTYTAGTEIRCGLRISAKVAFNLIANSDEQVNSQVPMGDFSLRLPLTTTVNPLDRVRITKRFGVDVTDQEYEIVGPKHRGSSCLVVKVRPIDKGDYVA